MKTEQLHNFIKELILNLSAFQSVLKKRMNLIEFFLH